MYTNTGSGEILKSKRIIGIFDLETASLGKVTREWLAAAEKEGRTRYGGTEIPLSVILVDREERRPARSHSDTLLILSQLTPKKLAKRSEQTPEQMRGEQLSSIKRP